MTKVGFGVIGAGVIGRIHASSIAQHREAALHWLVDFDPVRGTALTAAHGVKFGTSLDAMFADPAVDVVVVGSSTDSHEAHVLACVAAGKAILCEKPIADSLDGARRCLDAARRADVVAGVGFNRRFDAHHLRVTTAFAPARSGRSRRCAWSRAARRTRRPLRRPERAACCARKARTTTTSRAGSPTRSRSRSTRWEAA